MPGHQRKREDRQDKEAESQRDGHPFCAHREAEKASVPSKDAAWVTGLRCLGRGENDHAQQRSEQHRDEPGHQQRNGDDGEQRKRVFAGGAGREADRDKPRDRNQRAGQHGPCVGPEGEGAGRDLVIALRQPREHGVGRGHRVVDQQRQRDDERAKRYALHIDTRQLHDREHDRERQRDRQRDDEARPHAEADEADDHDDGDGLPQRGHELADGGSDRYGLVGNQLRLDADRQVAGDLGHDLLDVLAQCEDVAAVAHGDGKPDRRLAVHAKHRLRWIREGAADLGDVAEAKHAAADREVDVADVLLGLERAGYAQRQLLVAGLNDAGRPNDVLSLEGGDQSSIGRCRDWRDPASRIPRRCVRPARPGSRSWTRP